MKNKGAKPKCKKKGVSGAFGCDLTEYLETSGQDVPLVLKSCAEFIETHGVVDGIYRLSGITSNIQKLRQEFGSDQCPDLTREVYLQDIHCVGSLCKLYFRELPNPLLTYELYKKFTEAVSCFAAREQLARIQTVIQELPPSHYRTLEYLSKHLTNIASFSSMTNMHTRNLALVWAPNLLRSKEIEASGCNGDAAFLEVRVQQVVIEFILNHVDEIFNSDASPMGREHDDCKPIVKCMTLPSMSMSMPMKLVSLEEAQARSLAATHPARKERRENSLPEIGPVPGTFFHTVIDLPDNKRKLSTKSKKWKSIFNLGRSGADSKSKLSRNGSVFVRGQKLSEKTTIRPAKSMDSLCSLPTEGEEEKMSRFKRSVATGGFFIPVLKSRTAGTGSTFDLSKQENEWEEDGAAGAVGGLESGEDKASSTSPQLRPPPEQLKVFRAGEELESEQTSPKMRRMFYAGNDGSAKSNFPGSLFPLEASPRHQRKAMNISEPFAVSVPLRVSAVISSNSTPCRAPTKDKPFLSSLEELPSPGPEEAPTALLGEDGNVGSEESTASSVQDQNGNNETTESNSLAASTAENPAGLTTETQQALKTVEPLIDSKFTTGKPEPRSSPPPEEKPSPDLIFVPDRDPEHKLDLQPEGVTEENQRRLQEDNQAQVIAEQGTTQAHLNDPFHSVPVKDDLIRTLVEPLWPEIQDELKIIESEEELHIIVSDVSKIGQPKSPGPDTEVSLGANNFSISSGNNHTLAEEDIADTTIQVPAEVAISCAFAKEEEKDTRSLQSHESKNNVQKICTKNLPKLEDFPPEIASPKNLAPIADSMSDSPLREVEKIHENQKRLDISSEESSSPTRKSSDQVGEDYSTGILLPSLFKTNNSALAETWGQVKKDLLKIRSRGTREINDLQLPSQTVKEVLQQKTSVASKGQKSFDKEEDITWTDAVGTFDLMELWEDHQWVTSPLHSPKLKDIQEKEVQDFLPTRIGAKREFSRRPEFSRSLSLDSKDTRMSRWAVKKAFVRGAEGLLLDKLATEEEDIKLRSPQHNSGQNNQMDISGQPLKFEEPRSSLTNHSSIGGTKTGQVTLNPVSSAESKAEEEEPPNLSLTQTSLHFNPVDSLVKPEKPEEVSKPQNTIVGPIVNQKFPPKDLQLINSNGEETPCKPKTRPCSLNLESFLPGDDFFKFENLPTPSSPGDLHGGIKEPNTVIPRSPFHSGSGKTMVQSKVDLWQSRFDTQDLDLDYMAITHATTGRRNSAPVSVSAVRTSFMIKMCQAKAVPVIPPKLQYTQIPQPLQAQNSDSTAHASEREVINQMDSSLDCRQTLNPGKSHLDSPKSPRAEKKAKAEKENSDPTAIDSSSSRNTGITLSSDLSPSDRNSNPDAPVLRRKRTSDGEATRESSLSSKMERPSGFSKPSYRSRPGRPQSLILFSPPFPFMEHPSSLDSRTLLSPIKSPSHTNSQDPVCGDLSDIPRTPDGVTLRNKMTIPKSGQRLETSTSCFYQPQRRSVILDSRSSRQIE